MLCLEACPVKRKDAGEGKGQAEEEEREQEEHLVDGQLRRVRVQRDETLTPLTRMDRGAWRDNVGEPGGAGRVGHDDLLARGHGRMRSEGGGGAVERLARSSSVSACHSEIIYTLTYQGLQQGDTLFQENLGCRLPGYRPQSAPMKARRRGGGTGPK